MGAFRKSWVPACKRANLPGLMVYGLRRSGIRNLRAANVPRETIMRINGHKVESVYRRYAIVNVDDFRDAVKKLDSLLETQTANDQPNDTPQPGTRRLQ